MFCWSGQHTVCRNSIFNTPQLIYLFWFLWTVKDAAHLSMSSRPLGHQPVKIIHFSYNWFEKRSQGAGNKGLWLWPFQGDEWWPLPQVFPENQGTREASHQSFWAVVDVSNLKAWGTGKASSRFSCNISGQTMHLFLQLKWFQIRKTAQTYICLSTHFNFSACRIKLEGRVLQQASWQTCRVPEFPCSCRLQT